MNTTSTKKFLQSGLYYVRATWPYAIGEVLADALMPITKRLVLLLMLLGNFRYLSRHAEPGMSVSESFNLLWPVLISVFGVMLLPLMIATFAKLASRGRKRKTTQAVKQEFCRILFGSDEIIDSWQQYFNGQKAIMIYSVFVLIISPVFLYYSWRIYIVYLLVTILFGTICTKRITMSPEHKFGRLFNKFVDSDVYLNTVRYAAFCVYIVICAVAIIMAPHRIPVEFIFVIVIGMRVQLGRGKRIIGFFLWEAGMQDLQKQEDSEW